METRKRVLLVGLDPFIIDYSTMPGVTGELVMAMIQNSQTQLDTLGYDSQLCLVDFGETAEAVLAQQLAENNYDCVMIGAGVRAAPENLLLFEKLINVIHRGAASAAICFNTNPKTTVDAVQRWV